MLKRAAVLSTVGALSLIVAQEIPTSSSPMNRRYQEGEKLTYRMTGTNENWQYEIEANGVVKKDPSGKFVEEFGWSNLISNGTAVPLPLASTQFRQILSLDPDKPPSIPNLGAVHRMLIGPVTDLLAFYADLWLATRLGTLAQPGDRVYQKVGKPASWADGNRVIIGEDSIDFDLTLVDIDRPAGVATLLVRHVPPAHPEVQLPAGWMREPAAGTPNNWVQVTKSDDKYVAAVGKETFDVEIKVSLVDGKIISGSMDNSVKTQERDCRDVALKNCGAPRSHDILRRIMISLDR